MTTTDDAGPLARGALVARLLGSPLRAAEVEALAPDGARTVADLEARGDLERGADGSVRLANATHDRFLARLRTAVLAVEPAAEPVLEPVAEPALAADQGVPGR